MFLGAVGRVAGRFGAEFVWLDIRRYGTSPPSESNPHHS